MSSEKLTGRYDGDHRYGRPVTDDLHALRICYTAFINVLVMFVMILLLYRSIIGYQDDIVTRTLGFAADLFGDDGRGGNGTVGVPAAS
nr:envelope glycoprotein 24 [Murid betaherpesvirus 2]